MTLIKFYICILIIFALICVGGFARYTNITKVSNTIELEKRVAKIEKQIKELKTDIVMNKKVIYWKTIQKWARKVGIPEELPVVVQILETGHISHSKRARARSKVGAIGLQQIMPFHAKTYGYRPVDLYKPEVNIEVSCKILKHLYDHYEGNIELVLAGYNGGHGQARLHQSKRCYETYWYVKRGLNSYKWLKNRGQI